jgi:hypothetical protein
VDAALQASPDRPNFFSLQSLALRLPGSIAAFAGLTTEIAS